MFAVPVVIVDPDGSHSFFDGTLFQLDAELGGVSKIARYAAFARSGWHEIDHGYFAFVQPMASGERFVFAGISPTDTKPKKRLSAVTNFTKRNFEAFVTAISDRESSYQQKAQDDLNALVHDLRRLSTSIYHAAAAAKTSVEQNQRGDALTRIDNVIATQGMLKLRTDVLDYSGDTTQIHDPELVPVYRRTDKVVRCFTPQATAKGVTLQLIGESHSFSLGPNVFEIIPYVLIENAIKYAPRNSEIRIAFVETAQTIQIHFVSNGPNIARDERERIFEKGFRSKAAQSRRTSGSGIGLFLAKTLVEKFDGSISVEVGYDDVHSTEGLCKQITFVVSVPRNNGS